VFEASSIDVTGGERTLFDRISLSPAGTRAGRFRRRVRGIRARGRGRRSAGNFGGKRGRRRIGRTIIGEADDIWSSNNKSIEVIGVDVWPIVSFVHSREASEIAGGWLISASILHIHLTVRWSIL
jgi:hypothetical protein